MYIAIALTGVARLDDSRDENTQRSYTLCTAPVFKARLSLQRCGFKDADQTIPCSCSGQPSRTWNPSCVASYALSVTGDFPLYVQVCDELCSWFHVMDHTNYARWLPVHVRDMVQLSQKHPQLYAEFLKGNFVVQKSAHKFSLISKDNSLQLSHRLMLSGIQP